MDLFSLSDPMLALYLIEEEQETYIGRTEVIFNNLSPCFSKKLVAPFNQEKQQRIKIVVYDVDSKGDLNSFEKHDEIGSAVFDFKQIVGVFYLELELRNKRLSKTGVVKV